MNPEWKRGWASSVKLLMVLVAGTLGWMWGRGMSGTMRFWLPLLLASSCYGFEIVQKKDWKWSTLLFYGGMVFWYWGFMSIFSYGAGSFLRPLGVVFQRMIVGIAWSVPCLPIAWVNKKWVLYGLHIGVFTLLMTFIGGFDLMSAPEQEALIRGMFVAIPLFMVNWEE